MTLAVDTLGQSLGVYMYRCYLGIISARRKGLYDGHATKRNTAKSQRDQEDMNAFEQPPWILC